MHGRVVNVNKLRCIVEQRRIKACSAQGMPHFRGPIHAKNSNNSNNSKTTQNKLIETTYFNVPVHNFRTHIMQQSKFHIIVDVSLVLYYQCMDTTEGTAFGAKISAV